MKIEKTIERKKDFFFAEFEIAKKLRTLTDWIRSIDIIRVVVMVIISAVEESAITSGNKLTGEEKLQIAVNYLSGVLKLGGWYGFFLKVILKILVSYAVSEMNTRHGKEWGTQGVL